MNLIYIASSYESLYSLMIGSQRYKYEASISKPLKKLLNKNLQLIVSVSP